MGKKVLVTGDRNWSKIEPIRDALEYLWKNGYDTVIDGEARGADSIATVIAKRLGMKFIGYPAKWYAYGKAAGPVRNQQMLDEEHPDLVIWFHDDLSKSKGTKDMVQRSIIHHYKVIPGMEVVGNKEV